MPALDGIPARWYATIGPRGNQPIRMTWVGPASDGPGTVEEEMDWPRVVLVIEHPDGPMLYRYAATGEFAGDTWHETLDKAKHQAEFEYEDALGTWRKIPSDVLESESVQYVLSSAGSG